MKKTIITIVLVLLFGITTNSFAEANGGGFFHRGNTTEQENGLGNRGNASITPGLPKYGETDDQNAPLGSSLAVFLGLGAAYLFVKKREEE